MSGSTPEEHVPQAPAGGPARPSVPGQRGYLNRLMRMLGEMDDTDRVMDGLIERRQQREQAGAEGKDELDQ